VKAAVTSKAVKLRILGVDPGTRVVGYGLIDVSGPSVDYIECGVLRLPTAEPIPLRLHRLVVALGEVIDEFTPSVMAIEAAFHGVNAMSALKLGQARGAIMTMAVGRGLEVHEFPPATVKKAVTGSGRATKAEIQARVRLLCRLRREPSSDAADALAIALCYGHTRYALAPAGALRRTR
jgi:crossover junction endodeoxyribonuclease RuvC